MEKFGCYSTTFTAGNKEIKDALVSMEEDKCWLVDNDSKTRNWAFEKCAWVAWKRGFNTFGVDGNNTCSSGYSATTFYKGGSRNNCQPKLGGIHSNVVYYFTGKCVISRESHLRLQACCRSFRYVPFCANFRLYTRVCQFCEN